MNRLQIDLNVFKGDVVAQIHKQHPNLFKDCKSVHDVAFKIRDDYGLNHCLRILDTLIFTKK